MKTTLHSIFASFCLVGAVHAEALPWASRAWKSADGKEINAALVGGDTMKVQLRGPTGVDSEVYMNLLSAEDQKFFANEREKVLKELNAALKAAGPAVEAAKKANKPVLSLNSQLAARAYRLGVVVPGPGGGTISKVSGNVVGLSSFRKDNIETIIVELEGGIALAAGSHEVVFGGSKMKLVIEKQALMQYPERSLSSDDAAPKPSGPLTPVRLFGVGDKVTLSGQLHFKSEKIGTKTNYFARGYKLLTGVAKPIVAPPPPKKPAAKPPAKPAPKPTPKPPAKPKKKG